MNHRPSTTPVDGLQEHIYGIGHGAVTPNAHRILSSSNEQMVWQESPSPALLLVPAIKWALAILAATVLAGVIGGGWRFILLLMLGASIDLIRRFLQLRGVVYRMSSQRLEITSGFFNQVTVAHELHQMGDAMIVSPLTLRLFHCENLRILSHGINLVGIRKARAVRDLIRDAGQIEASRVDKVRWR